MKRVFTMVLVLAAVLFTTRPSQANPTLMNGDFSLRSTCAADPFDFWQGTLCGFTRQWNCCTKDKHGPGASACAGLTGDCLHIHVSGGFACCSSTAYTRIGSFRE